MDLMVQAAVLASKDPLNTDSPVERRPREVILSVFRDLAEQGLVGGSVDDFVALLGGEG